MNSIVEEGYPDELAIFQPRKLDTSVERYFWQSIQPIGSYSSKSVLEFNVPSSSYYIDLSCVYLKLSLGISQGDKRITKADQVGMVNNGFQSLWSQVDVNLQQQCVTSSVGSNYPYKTMMDTLLTKKGVQLDPEMSTQMYIKDEGSSKENAMDSVITSLSVGESGVSAENINVGLINRANSTREGQSVPLMGLVNFDLATQKKYMLNGVAINLKFWPSKSGFRLMAKSAVAKAEPNYDIDIINPTLMVRCVVVSSIIHVSHSHALDSALASYHFLRSEMKTFAVSSGQFAFNQDDIFRGRIPESVLVGMVRSEAYNGSYALNPFNFQHFNCNYAGLFVDGNAVPFQPLQPNYETDSYVECYLRTFRDTGSDVKLQEYPKGYCLYKFDLSHNEAHGYSSPLRQGHTRLEFKFAKPLEESVSIIVYAKFPGSVHFDKVRNIRIE